MQSNKGLSELIVEQKEGRQSILHLYTHSCLLTLLTAHQSKLSSLRLIFAVFAIFRSDDITGFDPPQ
jgi:hypothetical protein